MSWTRIFSLLAGLAPIVAPYLQDDKVPPWAQIGGGILFGIAINGERLMKKRKKGAPTFDTSALKVLAFASLALSVQACKSTGDIYLPTDVAARFQSLIGHQAVTPSENGAIYGTDGPPSACLKGHEEWHKKQARKIADHQVAAGIIDDDELSRMATWLFFYGLDYAQYGYDNRFEKEAREVTKGICSG